MTRPLPHLLHPRPRIIRSLRALAGVRLIAGLFALLLCLQVPAALAQVAFGACPIEAYQTIQVGGSYGLYTINVGDGTLTLQGTDTELQGNNSGNTNGINAIGFNESDRFIYGWNPSTHQIVRVGQNGVASYLGPTPAGLGSYSPNVGDVYNGRLYLLSGTNFQVVDLATNTVVQSGTVTNASPLTDWAFNATDGLLYAVRNSDGAIVRINPGTGVGVVVPGVTVPVGTFGAQYFDSQGSLYASRNDGIIYRIRNAAGGGTPSVQVLTTAVPPTGQNDGARCPNAAPPIASVSVRKQLTAESGSLPGRAEANEQLTYRFTLINNGQAATNGPYGFYEVIPANTTLVSVAGATSDCTVGVAGARLCTITIAASIPGNGGTAIATVVVRVANPIPAGVTQILNLATDDANTAPGGCTNSNQPCATPPTCDTTSDPNHCVALPLPAADLRITKTNTPASGASDQAADTLVSGSTTTYSIVVTNGGADAANGAIVKDPAPTGLTCTTATCGNPLNGAACPAVTGPALLTALQSANGVSIPTLPGNGAVTFTMTCTVP